MHSEGGSHAVATPTLVLVAPLARRPIALVARRQHARARASRSVSSSSIHATPTSPLPASPDSAQSNPDGAARAGATPANAVRLVAHPYTRAKTPSNATNASSASNASNAPSCTVGMGGLVGSPPPRTRSRMTTRSASVRPSGAGGGGELADEPMATDDVERTPTKPRSRLDAHPPRVELDKLTLSPTSPTTQRLDAVEAASSQLTLLSSPTLPSVETRTEGVGSVVGSPCLSESLSRSPSTSPSPCPSPPLALFDVDPSRRTARTPAFGKPAALPPMPTSPIPRRMTRNPFERYLSLHPAPDPFAAKAGGTLAARLANAIAATPSTHPEQPQPTELLTADKPTRLAAAMDLED